VSEGMDGFLSLSYMQVHTAKIAIIEDDVDVLKRRVTELESKLQKY
jgi:ubiquinone biosynthesis protein UbiJ